MTDNTKSTTQNRAPVESGTEYKGLRVPPPSGFSLEGGHNVPPPPAALVQEGLRVPPSPTPLAQNGVNVPPPPPQARVRSGQGGSGETKPTSTPTSSPPKTPSS